MPPPARRTENFFVLRTLWHRKTAARCVSKVYTEIPLKRSRNIALLVLVPVFVTICCVFLIWRFNDLKTAIEVGALFGPILSLFVSNFLAEDYRRFCDGGAVAAGLLGELKSHGEALPLLEPLIHKMIDAAKNEVRLPYRMPVLPESLDPIFDASISKLGLLDPKVVEDVAYVYEQLRAFRGGFQLIFSTPDMTHLEIISRCNAALQTLDRVKKRGEPLLESLRFRADEDFF